MFLYDRLGVVIFWWITPGTFTNHTPHKCLVCVQRQERLNTPRDCLGPEIKLYGQMQWHLMRVAQIPKVITCRVSVSANNQRCAVVIHRKLLYLSHSVVLSDEGSKMPPISVAQNIVALNRVHFYRLAGGWAGRMNSYRVAFGRDDDRICQLPIRPFCVESNFSKGGKSIEEGHRYNRLKRNRFRKWSSFWLVENDNSSQDSELSLGSAISRICGDAKMMTSVGQTKGGHSRE